MASRGVNKVILLGRLGKDPEVRYMPNGGAVANFTMATSETWKDKQTGESQEKTEWHRLVAFRKLAEIIGEHVKKGSDIFVEGRLQTRKWQDRQGHDRYTTEIVVDSFQFVGERKSSSPQQAGYGQQRTTPQSAPQADSSGGGFEDDIPF